MKPGKMLKLGARCWALTNFGLFLGTYRTRARAKEAAEKRTGEPWSVCSAYMDVRRVTVVEGWK